MGLIERFRGIVSIIGPATSPLTTEELQSELKVQGDKTSIKLSANFNVPGWYIMRAGNKYSIRLPVFRSTVNLAERLKLITSSPHNLGSFGKKLWKFAPNPAPFATHFSENLDGYFKSAFGHKIEALTQYLYTTKEFNQRVPSADVWYEWAKKAHFQYSNYSTKLKKKLIRNINPLFQAKSYFKRIVGLLRESKKIEVYAKPLFYVKGHKPPIIG